jgi:type IV pilus assembly protein PilC
MLSHKVLSQLFMDVHNMFLTGMNVNQMFICLQQTTTDKNLCEVLVQVGDGMRKGESLAKSLEETGQFPWIVHSTINAGERTGRLNSAVLVLAQYFKRSHEMHNKILNASLYPLIVFIFLIGVMTFISCKIVPKLKTLLPPDSLSNPITHGMLILTGFIKTTAPILIFLIVVGGIFLIHYWQKHNSKIEEYSYRIPIFGQIFKESALSLYFLNLSALLKSGVPLIKAIVGMNESSQNCITQRLSTCREYMLGGLSFWEAVEKDPFFPQVIIFTLRRGEESAKIDEYCTQLSEYFNQQVQSRSEQIIHLIQPLLLSFGGLFLILIAFAFLVPIYGSLSKIAGG